MDKSSKPKDNAGNSEATRIAAEAQAKAAAEALAEQQRQAELKRQEQIRRQKELDEQQRQNEQKLKAEQANIAPANTPNQVLPNLSIIDDKPKPTGAAPVAETPALEQNTIRPNAPSLSITPESTPAPSPKPENLAPLASLTESQTSSLANQLRRDLGKENQFLDLVTGGDTKAVSNTLSQYSPEQRQEIQAKYEKQYGQGSFSRDLRTELGDGGAREIAHLMQAKSDGQSLNYFDNKLRLLEETRLGADNPATQLSPGTLLSSIVQPGIGGLAGMAQQQVENKKQEEGHQRDIMQQLSILDSKQIEDLNQQSLRQYGRPLSERLLSSEAFSADNKKVMEIYLQGADKLTIDARMQIADLALRSGNTDLLESGLRNSPEARQRLSANPQTEELLNSNFDPSDRQRARDILSFGDETLATQVSQSQTKALGFLWNTGADEKTVTQAIDAMPKEQRVMYLQGQTFVREHSTPAKPEDQKAVDFYNRVNQSIETGFDDRKALEMKARIAYGPESLVSSILETRNQGMIFGLGAHNSDSKVAGLVDNLSASDWKRLREDKLFLEDTRRAINESMDPEKARVTLDTLGQKLSLDDKNYTFEQSQTVQHSALTRLTFAGAENPADKARLSIAAITALTPDEIARYKNDKNYKTQIDTVLQNTLGNGQALELTTAMLERVQRGQASALTPIERVQLGVVTDAKLDQTVTNIEAALAADPTLRARLQKPQSKEDQELRDKFDSAILSSVLASGVCGGGAEGGDLSYQQHEARRISEMLYRNEGVPLNEKLRMASSNQAKYDLVLQSLPEVQNKLFQVNPDSDTKLYQDRIFASFSQEERHALFQIHQNRTASASDGASLQPNLVTGNSSELKAEDRLRLLILNSESSPEQIKASLANLSAEQMNQVKASYASSYGADLGADVLARVPKERQNEFLQSLMGYRQSDSEALMQLQNQRSENESGILGNVDYGSRFTAVDTTNDFLARAQSASASGQEIPSDERQQLLRNANTALATWSGARAETADTVTEGVIVVGALTATVASGGTAGPLLIMAVGGTGAALKVTGKELLLGQQYDTSNLQTVSADAASGFISAAGTMVGPEHLAGVLRVGNRLGSSVASSVVRELAEQGVQVTMREGGEEILEQGLQRMLRDSISRGSTKVDGKAIKALAAQVAPGASASANAELLENSIIRALQASKPTSAQALLTEVALNSASGSASNMIGTATESTINWDTRQSMQGNLSRILDNSSRAAADGLVFGAGGTLALKSLGTLGSRSLNRFSDESMHFRQMNSLNDDSSIWLSFNYENSLDNSLSQVSPDGPRTIHPLTLRNGKELIPQQRPDLLPSSFDITNNGSTYRLGPDERITRQQRRVVRPEFLNLDNNELLARSRAAGIFDANNIPNYEKYLAEGTTPQNRYFYSATINNNTQFLAPVEVFGPEMRVRQDGSRVLAPTSESGFRMVPPNTMANELTPAAADNLTQPRLAEPTPPNDAGSLNVPEFLGQRLDNSADGGRTVSSILIENRASVDDPFLTLQKIESLKGNPFVSAASMNIENGDMTFYNWNGSPNLMRMANDMDHEIAHRWEYVNPMRAPYDDAVKLEELVEPRERRVLFNDYAATNAQENWAVHLGEAYVAPDDKGLRALVEQSKDRAGSIKEYLHARALEEQLKIGVQNGHLPADQSKWSPWHKELLRRSLWAQEELRPAAQRQIENILQTPGASIEAKDKATSLFGQVFDQETCQRMLQNRELAPELRGAALTTLVRNGNENIKETLREAMADSSLSRADRRRAAWAYYLGAADSGRIADSELADPKALMTALARKNGGEVPLSALRDMATQDSVFSNAAYMELLSRNTPDARAIAGDIFNSGHLTKKLLSTGDGEDAALISEHITRNVADPAERIGLMRATLENCASNQNAQDALLPALMFVGNAPRFEGEELIFLTRWTAENVSRSRLFPIVLRGGPYNWGEPVSSIAREALQQSVQPNLRSAPSW